ncbi:hypothetical protein [Capnocytophaga cynodegmi]|uniref:hypothetical protein n=1 Tax=Capnocytophaga cynodegmi TaxID=28189 RepID=UPI003858DD70
MKNTLEILPMNLTAEQFCKTLGLAHNYQIMEQLRALKLVTFFKVGKKYLYPRTNIYKIQQMLVNQEISIKVDKGYYITLNR